MSAAARKPKLVVMLTGGIGSGKTTVSDRFATIGIDVVDSDIAARTIMEPGKPAYAAVVARFGESVLTDEEQINRPELRKRVFSDLEHRRWLEALTHPLIGIELQLGVRAARPPYCILVVPLFNPKRRHPLATRVLVVDTPEPAQITRTMARDANSATQVRAIMAAQVGRADRLAGADDVIVNDGSIADLDDQIAALDTKYRAIAATN